MIGAMSRPEKKQAAAVRFGAVAMALAVGCSGGTASGTPQHQSGGAVRAKAKKGKKAKPRRRSKIPLAELRKADQAKPRPRKLPTIANIRWDAFPNDLTGPYGKSGRQVLLRPGKPGIIADAIFAAKKGDTILLHGGTYKEGHADDDAALRIEQDGVVLRAVPGERPIITPQGAGTKRGILIGGSHVMIQGIDLVGFSAVGIGLGTVGKTVEGTILSELKLDLPGSGQWVDGISVWPDMRSSGKAAVDGLLIRNVLVKGASLGISCNAGPCNNLWLENVLVKGAPGTGSGADTVAVESGKNVVLVNVEVSGASADGVDLKAKDVLVWGCNIHNVSRNGLKLWHGGDVVNTVIHHTGADASVVLFKGTYRLLNSLVAFHNYRGSKSYNLTAGYGIETPIKVSLINSIFYNTSGGMYFSNKAKVKVESCIFSGIQNGNLMQVRAAGKQVILTPLAFGARSRRLGLGRGNKVADPGFVAPKKGDFRLKAGSAGVDRGVVAAPYPRVDLSGMLRVQGKAPDIGPYERAP